MKWAETLVVVVFTLEYGININKCQGACVWSRSTKTNLSPKHLRVAQIVYNKSFSSNGGWTLILRVSRGCRNKSRGREGSTGAAQLLQRRNPEIRPEIWSQSDSCRWTGSKCCFSSRDMGWKGLVIRAELSRALQHEDVVPKSAVRFNWIHSSY